MAFDIFPATLDDLYAMDWSGSTSRQQCVTKFSFTPPFFPKECRTVTEGIPFPTQHDRDGDGLLAGIDPDDGTVDIDGDGVIDARELEIGTDPRIKDSDGDGLDDDEELARGTDPLARDGDGDGLDDLDELNGVLFTYNTGKQTRVYTDPQDGDTDGDGFGDQAEPNLVLNPRVADQNPLQLTLALADADQIVKPGVALDYSVNVRNALKPGDYGRSGQIYASAR